MKPRPMPFWAEDWLTSLAVQTMTAEEQGGYFRLLCYCWTARDHALPDDDVKLLLLSRLSAETWERGNVRAQFTPHPTIPGAISNRRILEISADDAAYRRKKAKAGRNSAAARRERRANTSSTLPPTERQPPSPSPSPSPIRERVSRKATPPPPPDWPGLKLAEDWSLEQKAVASALPGWWAALQKLEAAHGWAEVARVVAWVRQDEFWSRNCRSPSKLLRLDKDGIRYWDRVKFDMEQPRRDNRRGLLDIPPLLTEATR